VKHGRGAARFHLRHQRGEISVVALVRGRNVEHEKSPLVGTGGDRPFFV